mgnify:FL=1
MEHKRQFLICNKEFSHTNFNHVTLLSGFSLYYHTDLDVAFSNCKVNVLIGSAFKSTQGTISNDLNTINTDNIADITSDWSGRWLIIIGNSLHIDPGGMLGCYYGLQAGEPVLSSSLALLNEIFSFEKNNDYKDIKHGNAMNWFPPPLTIFNGVKKLLVGQAININEGTIKRAGKRENKFKHLAQSEIYTTLAIRLTTIVKNVSQVYGEEIYLPLTAGYDSRTLLAALLNSQTSFSAFLFEHENISAADKKTPVILAQKFNFLFSFIKRSNTFDKAKYNEYIEHSSGQAADAGILFHAYDQYEPLKSKSHSKKKIILRGGVWETGRNFYPTIDNALTLEEDILANLKPRFPILRESKLHEESVKLWIQHTQATHSNLSFRDRFYLEQRVSGWLAALEQAMDLTSFDRIHPANCQDIIDLLALTEFNPQPKIIQELQPKLLETAFNPRSLKEILKDFYYFAYHKLRR